MRFLALFVGLASIAGSVHAADAAHPLVLELFQSQGCAACPPADANAAKLAQRSDMLVLNFAVTYWDRRGWRDTYARPEFTRRQISYARALHHTSAVFTPNVVLNGRADGIGADPDKLDALIKANDRGQGGPSILLRKTDVSLSNALAAKGADLWLIRFDPRVLRVSIRAGENGGKTLPQRNIVRSLNRLARLSGAEETFALPASDDNLETAVLVQRRGGGPIIAAVAGG